MDGKCELVWAQIQVPGSSQLFVGSFYCAPDVNDPEYLGPLQICLGRIPVAMVHIPGLVGTLTSAI